MASLAGANLAGLQVQLAAAQAALDVASNALTIAASNLQTTYLAASQPPIGASMTLLTSLVAAWNNATNIYNIALLTYTEAKSLVDSLAFAILGIGADVTPPPTGGATSPKIVSLRIQDVTRQIWFNWDNGVVTGGDGGANFSCTKGGQCYIAAYVKNEGAAGTIGLHIVNSDSGVSLKDKVEVVAAGGTMGIEYTGTFPQLPYVNFRVDAV